jgi:hypothetical protein
LSPGPPYETYKTPWRRPAALGTWPIPWRQAWADRCEGLEALGVGYPEHERIAFEEVAGRVDPAALRDLDRWPIERPGPSPVLIEADDGTVLVEDPGDPFFGPASRSAPRRGATRAQLDAARTP